MMKLIVGVLGARGYELSFGRAGYLRGRARDAGVPYKHIPQLRRILETWQNEGIAIQDLDLESIGDLLSAEVPRPLGEIMKSVKGTLGRFQSRAAAEKGAAAAAAASGGGAAAASGGGGGGVAAAAAASGSSFRTKVHKRHPDSSFDPESSFYPDSSFDPESKVPIHQDPEAKDDSDKIAEIDNGTEVDVIGFKPKYDGQLTRLLYMIRHDYVISDVWCQIRTKGDNPIEGWTRMDNVDRYYEQVLDAVKSRASKSSRGYDSD